MVVLSSRVVCLLLLVLAQQQQLCGQRLRMVVWRVVVLTVPCFTAVPPSLAGWVHRRVLQLLLLLLRGQQQQAPAAVAVEAGLAGHLRHCSGEARGIMLLLLLLPPGRPLRVPHSLPMAAASVVRATTATLAARQQVVVCKGSSSSISGGLMALVPAAAAAGVTGSSWTLLQRVLYNSSSRAGMALTARDTPVRAVVVLLGAGHLRLHNWRRNRSVSGGNSSSSRKGPGRRQAWLHCGKQHQRQAATLTSLKHPLLLRLWRAARVVALARDGSTSSTSSHSGGSGAVTINSSSSSSLMSSSRCCCSSRRCSVAWESTARRRRVCWHSSKKASGIDSSWSSSSSRAVEVQRWWQGIHSSCSRRCLVVLVTPMR